MLPGMARLKKKKGSAPPPPRMAAPTIRDRIVELRRVPASSLIPSPHNWRTHPQSQQDALQGVLDEIGYADALIARERDDGGLVLIDGHLRKDTTPDAVVPVLVLDVDEAEADKLLVSLDPLAAMAGADQGRLVALLRDVRTGNEAVAAMLQELAQKNGIGPDLPTPGAGGDEFDTQAALEGECRVQTGDLWLIDGGRHRLVCGDRTEAATVEMVLAGEKPFLMVTDPPYGVNYDPNWRNEAAAQGHLAYAAIRIGEVANDERIDWEEAWELSPSLVAYCWHADRHASVIQQSLEEVGFEIRCQVIWAKSNFPISRGHYHWRHEPCWYAVREGSTAKWIGDRLQTTLWEINLDKNVEGGHSTQKPLECMARPIRNHEGDVYDPFLGSGTTLIAAQRLGRRCFGVEIEPHYCEVVLRRAEAEGLTVERAE